jgi:hypothetical protein
MDIQPENLFEQEEIRVQFVMRRNLLAVTIAVLVLLPFVLTAAEISLCHVDCVCIFWTTLAGGTQELRCPIGGFPSGWTNGGAPPDGGGGSWGGPGTGQTPPSPLPGNVLNPITSGYVTSAKGSAVTKLRGEKVTDPGTRKGTWLPTPCTDLFLNNPLGESGASLLGSYVVFRDGTGTKDAQGVDQCATGAFGAWTTCCQHDPVIFICPAKFNTSSPSDRIKYLIHETMHVAGQQEDKNGTVGPGDPPNSSQINDAVDTACN